MKPYNRKVDIPTFVLHWSLVLSLVVGLGTGLRIAYDHMAAWRDNGPIREAMSMLPVTTVFEYHIVNGYALATIVAIYLGFVVLGKQGQRYRFWSRPGETAVLPLRRRLNRLLYGLAAGLLLVAIISGTLLYLEIPAVALDRLRDWHRYNALALLGYPFVHVAAQFVDGGLNQLLAVFRIRSARLVPAAIAAFAGFVLLALAILLDRNSEAVLEVARIREAPTVDGSPADAAWRQLPVAVIRTKLGNGADAAGPAVRVQAGLSGTRIYLLFSWPDATASLQHLPLVKTEGGWRVRHNGYPRDDETIYYEDKFAVMLARQADAAIDSIHLASQPLTGAPPSRSGRGYHYTTDASVLDIWHWKAVRTNVLHQADDAYFGPPRPVYPSQPRYKAGYANDPKLGGGYRPNWTFFHAETVEPKRLPLTSRHWYRLNENGPSVEDEPRPMHMRWGDAYPFDAGTDRVPVGTAIPSVLTTHAFEGDRGDVGARGRWIEGRWYLEVSRRLETGSEYDVAITAGTYLWVAVFDHAQTRHSYHLRPLKLHFESGHE